MLDASARLLRLLPLLPSRPEWTGPELAGRLGVTVRTLRRDVAKLRDLGYPVAMNAAQFPPGGAGLNANSFEPHRFDTDRHLTHRSARHQVAGPEDEIHPHSA